MALILTKDRTVFGPTGLRTGIELAGTVSYPGAVLATGTETVRIMSDVWADGYFARVWDGTAVVKVSTGNSEFGGGVTAEVDATPDVVAAANGWLLASKVAALKADFERRAYAADEVARTVGRGKTVIVARGRKIPKGTTGVVFWTGEGRFGTRAGFKDAAGETVWIAASNLDVVPDPDAEVIEVPSDEALTARATRELSEVDSYFKTTGWFTVRAA